MTRPISVTSNELTLYAALELSKNSWLLGVQFTDRDKPSLYPLKGGDADGLLDKLAAARNRVANQGISKAGNSLVRAILIQSAWMWLRHQPDSALSQWFRKRTEGHARRVRCIMITALARKLAVALWRYLETGLIPEGATLTAK